MKNKSRLICPKCGNNETFLTVKVLPIVITINGNMDTMTYELKGRTNWDPDIDKITCSVCEYKTTMGKFPREVLKPKKKASKKNASRGSSD